MLNNLGTSNTKTKQIRPSLFLHRCGPERAPSLGLWAAGGHVQSRASLSQSGERHEILPYARGPFSMFVEGGRKGEKRKAVFLVQLKKLCFLGRE